MLDVTTNIFSSFEIFEDATLPCLKISGMSFISLVDSFSNCS